MTIDNITHGPTVAIFGSRRQEAYLQQINILLNLLEKNGFDIAIHPHIYSYLSEQNIDFPACCYKSDTAPDYAKVALSIGGDGTFLRTAGWVGNRNIPILGINTGHLGFLAMCDIEEVETIVTDIIDDRFVVEQRSLLKIEAPYIPDNFWPYALNEIAILKQDTASMITVQTMVDDSFLTDYLADGLLISTPTGSTGYNMSVGGPILRPTLENWVLSPIAPHSLTMRPLVINSDATIKACTRSRAKTYRISADGRSFSLPCGSTITIRKAEFPILVMRRRDDNFASTLRNKLLWGTR